MEEKGEKVTPIMLPVDAVRVNLAGILYLSGGGGRRDMGTREKEGWKYGKTTFSQSKSSLRVALPSARRGENGVSSPFSRRRGEGTAMRRLVEKGQRGLAGANKKGCGTRDV